MGANYQFGGENKAGCIGTWMGGQNKKYSENYELMSLAVAHGTAVKVSTPPQ